MTDQREIAITQISFTEWWARFAHAILFCFWRRKRSCRAASSVPGDDSSSRCRLMGEAALLVAGFSHACRLLCSL